MSQSAETAQAPEPDALFARFRELYPDPERRWPAARVAWERLTPAEREAALAHAPAFIAFVRGMGRSITPAPRRYLEDRRWTMLPGVKA
ncbi:hypothetical protein [Microcystis phage vB_MweS-yong2]|nr:hypothetical protein [Microcystis phage vB_MweS-yong2]